MKPVRTPLHRLADLIRRFRRDQRGQIALMFALAAPAVILIGVGAIDLSNVQSARTRLQDIADAAALAGANELSLAIDDQTAVERARAYVDGHLKDWAKAPNVTPSIRVLLRDEQRVIEVILKGHTPSFFANMLPPGGWKYSAESRAVSVGMTPLCVLITGASGDKMLNVKDSSRLQAPECLIHSNRDIMVEGGSIAASQVQAVTSASGMISPAAGTGAASIPDPFTGLNLTTTGKCRLLDPLLVYVLFGRYYLQPGVHCGAIEMAGNSELVLLPGDHFFAGGKLIIKEGARLTGDDVVLLFNKASKFEFKDRATVSLNGRRSGQYAGIVMAAFRGNTQDFIISSDNVESLLGVIYVPEAKLMVEGSADVARDSAWTVIVTRELQMKGSPSLIINANYDASNVPVPTGVGPRGGGAQLVE